ncbi:phosphotransferase family protein [Streptomyces sp. NPDC087263]|uniref:phosphotransferase family protein n=1 Tax=Streptomyces sp. NPDC087263 TaxID=3365773 RepID=UPI0038014EC4
MTTTADPELIRPAPPTMASPSWWGADSDRHRVLPGHGATQGAFVKVMRPATTAYVHLPTAFGAALAAGEAGIGPRELHASMAERTLVLEDLTGRAKTATLHDFLDQDLVHRYLALRRAVGSLAVPDPRRASVFDDIRSLCALTAQQATVLPRDLPWMLRVLDDAEQRIAATGYDTEFCHGDGNVSNVLIDERRRPYLVDWDSAAVMDPLQDIGASLAELAPSDDDARELFESAWGIWDAKLFDRARVYGAADLVRWGLTGAYVDSVDPGTFEYSKFSDWQFLRARWALTASQFDDRLRNL